MDAPRVPAYVRAVVRRKVGERGAELLDLRVEAFDLGGGNLGGERVEGPE